MWIIFAFRKTLNVYKRLLKLKLLHSSEENILEMGMFLNHIIPNNYLEKSIRKTTLVRGFRSYLNVKRSVFGSIVGSRMISNLIQLLSGFILKKKNQSGN